MASLMRRGQSLRHRIGGKKKKNRRRDVEGAACAPSEEPREDSMREKPDASTKNEESSGPDGARRGRASGGADVDPAGSASDPLVAADRSEAAVREGRGGGKAVKGTVGDAADLSAELGAFVEKNGGVDLSARAASRKHTLEAAAVLGGSSTASDARESYERQLLLDRLGQGAGGGDGDDEDDTPPHPSLDEKRRTELQSALRDKSLTKEERKVKMDGIKAKYAAIAEEQQCDRGNTQARPLVNIDLSAKSYALRPQKEMQSVAAKSLTVSERRAIYDRNSAITAGEEQRRGAGPSDHKHKRALRLHAENRNQTVARVDPTAFAVAENGFYGVQRVKKNTVRHEYAGRRF